MTSTEPIEPPERIGPLPTPPLPKWTVPLLIGVALLLRGAQARGASLWLDELHTWHHASAPGLRELFASLRADNHPPLSFLLVRAARAVFGESELALRLPSILAGAACVPVAARLARRLPGPRSHWIAPLLVAVSSLHLVASAEARMYALLALFSALALVGALAVLDGDARRGAWLFALSLALGFHTHYHAVYVAVVLGGALLFVAPRARLRALVVPSSVALALCAPWAIWGLSAQLGHDLAPGGAGGGVRALASGMAGLVFHDPDLATSLVTRRLGEVFEAGALVAFATALAGAFALVRRPALGSGPQTVPGAGVLLAALAFGEPLLAAVLAAWLPRAGFHWMYLTPSVVPFAVLIAREADDGGPYRPVRRSLVGFVVMLAPLLAVLHLLGPSREDQRGAARRVLAEARSTDLVVAADWQPALFPQGLGWRYYADRLTTGAVPPTLAVGPGFAIAEPGRLKDADRVFVIGRSLPNDAALFLTLRARFPHEEVERFGEAMFVHRFSR